MQEEPQNRKKEGVRCSGKPVFQWWESSQRSHWLIHQEWWQKRISIYTLFVPTRFPLIICLIYRIIVYTMQSFPLSSFDGLFLPSIDIVFHIIQFLKSELLAPKNGRLMYQFPLLDPRFGYQMHENFLVSFAKQSTASRTARRALSQSEQGTTPKRK